MKDIYDKVNTIVMKISIVEANSINLLLESLEFYIFIVLYTRTVLEMLGLSHMGNR